MKAAIALLFAFAGICSAQIAIRGEKVYTMAGPPIENGIVLIENGKISRVGPASSVTIPAGMKVLNAKVVTPGLVDAHSTVGLTGYLNQAQDQDELEKSAPIQPDLRAMDAYDFDERLIEWVRGFGVTTMNTGHAPGELISGQTMIVKTRGASAEEAAIVPVAMVACSLGDEGLAGEGKSPGTRAKEVAMLREEFIKAREYANKKKDAPRDLDLEVMARVLKGELPLLVTAQRSRDIMDALRLGKEFKLKIVLDGAAEAPLVLNEIKASGYPVIVHPTMYRALGETENLSFETAAKLQAAGIPWALQSGYESYVPKTRVILFEAAIAAANGLTFDQALAGITINAARIIGVANRVGSLETGKDGDVALYDGDPFEYTSHCVGTVIEGRQVSAEVR